MAKQESVAGWHELAKAYARAERELEIKPYFRVEFRKKKTQELVFSYDLPRDMYWEKQWVVRWRLAKLICQYPREDITQYIIPYDKSSGLKVGFGSCLSKLAAIKAHITMLENERKDYIASQQGQLFFDESTDAHLLRIAEKMQSQKENYIQLEAQIKGMVECHKKALDNQKKKANE